MGRLHLKKYWGFVPKQLWGQNDFTLRPFEVHDRSWLIFEASSNKSHFQNVFRLITSLFKLQSTFVLHKAKKSCHFPISFLEVKEIRLVKTRGQFLVRFLLSKRHRDSSIQLRRSPTSNFFAAFCSKKANGKPYFEQSTPDIRLLKKSNFWRCIRTQFQEFLVVRIKPWNDGPKWTTS